MIAAAAPRLERAAMLERVAAGAERRDAAGGFPAEPLAALRDGDALAASAALGATREAEWALVRAVAARDGSVGRILDGHLNAVERLAVHASPALREAELARVAAGELRLGVWGADPAGDEGEPARLDAAGRVTGVKVFCSGAGGLDRAVVLVRDASGAGPPLAAYVDLAAGVDVDPRWFRAAGMRSSESHRVVFRGARVVEVLGPPGALAAEPWFSRDAQRTAFAWIGMVDALRAAALRELAPRAGSELVALAAARVDAAHATVDVWAREAARCADDAAPDRVRARSLRLRAAVAEGAATMVAAVAGAAGSRPWATGGELDRVRRDLELMLRQKRLDPLLARHGRALLEARAR